MECDDFQEQTLKLPVDLTFSGLLHVNITLNNI